MKIKIKDVLEIDQKKEFLNDLLEQIHRMRIDLDKNKSLVDELFEINQNQQKRIVELENNSVKLRVKKVKKVIPKEFIHLKEFERTFKFCSSTYLTFLINLSHDKEIKIKTFHDGTKIYVNYKEAIEFLEKGYCPSKRVNKFYGLCREFIPEIKEVLEELKEEKVEEKFNE